MTKHNLLKLGGVVFVLFFALSQAAYADPWTETSTTVYQTDTTKNVGIGTTAPTYEIHGVSDQGTVDPFVFQGYNGARGERDIFSIKTLDYLSPTQDESSLLQVWASGAWNNDADAASLAEFTYTGTIPTVSDRQFYLLGRTANEGTVNWGISLTDSDFWTRGDINGGATSTDCGGTGTACFNSPSFHFAASGDSYITSGNVGIGTSSPTRLLQLTNASSNTGIRIESTGSDADYFLYSGVGGMDKFSIYDEDAGLDRLVIDSSGNVGIGTISPSNTLQVVGTIAIDDQAVLNTDSSDISIGDLAGGDGYRNLGLYAGDTRAMTITTSGNVGIGTSSPSYTLDVQGTVNATTLCIAGDCRTTWPSGGGSSGIDGSGTANYLTKWVDGDTLTNSIAYDSGSSLSILYSGSPGLEIRSTGSGTPFLDFSNDSSIDYDGRIILENNDQLTVRGANLDVEGDISLDDDLTVGDRLCLGGTCLNTWPWEISGTNMYSGVTGNVGIGDDTPESKLKVANDDGGDEFANIQGENWATTGNTGGIFGMTASDGVGSGSPAGVFGWAYNSGEGGDTFGVLGRTSTSGGHDATSSDNTTAAVYGEAVNTSGINIGVWGETFSSDTGVAGVLGVANTSSGVVYGVAGRNDSSTYGSYAVYYSGGLAGTGLKDAIIYTERQGPSEVYSIEASEVWFEDIGAGQLQNGKAQIKLDPLFLETVTIDEQHPMQVFIQPYDNASLYVKPGTDFFEVFELNNGQSNAKFAYRVMAKRKYYEDRRLTPVPASIDKFMRPDLTKEELKVLNERWGLRFEDLEERRLERLSIVEAETIKQVP